MLDTAFHLAGAAVSWLELLAFLLALAGVALTARVSVWGWPPTIAASALYGWLFFEHRLYGDAALQGFFIAISIWGWRAWLQPVPDSGDAARPDGVTSPDDVTSQGDAVRQGDAARQGIRSLAGRAVLRLLVALVVAWLVLGALLSRFTDTDVPWFDAAPTAGSLFAQVLLARKWLQAWPLWVGVNTVAIALFASKALWLTALLYALLLVMSVAGWIHWRRLLR